MIEELTCDWEPDKHTDRYRARLKRVVARKRKDETINAPANAAQPEPASDLMAALEQTLEELSARGSGRWSEKRTAETAN